MQVAVSRIAPHTRPGRFAVLTAVLLLAVLLTAIQLVGSRAQKASAMATVTCGQTITASVTLTADLGPCPGDGLHIGKAGITLNLGGHTITGPGSGQGQAWGIFVNQLSTVTITNGTIRAFYFNVFSNSSHMNKLTNLRLGNGVHGIHLSGSEGAVISGTTIYSNAVGISVSAGSSVQFTNNTLQGNSTRGFQSVNSPGMTLSGNKVTSTSGVGIELGSGTTGTVMTSNVTNSNAGDGVLSSDPTAKFTTNTADYNQGLGIRAAPGSIDGGGNHGQDNTNALQCANVVCVPV